MIAVVPLRDGTSGKSRLAATLDTAARSELVRALARHVVATLVAAPGLRRVIVVTADTRFATTTLTGFPAERVEVVSQPSHLPGLNAAVEIGRQHAAALGDRMLVAHADLPALNGRDIAALLAVDAPVVIAADRERSGTNILLVATDTPFTFRFGPGSLAAHRQEAARRGLRAVVVHRPGTSVDLDTAVDWSHLPEAARRSIARDAPRAVTALDSDR